MRNPFKLISLIVLVCFVSSCASPHVISDAGGQILVKGPRRAFGPSHDPYTVDAQVAANQRCIEAGGDGATYIGGQVILFDGDYTKFTCTISTEKIMQSAAVRNALDKIGLCVRSNIVELDDLTSDAATIANGIASVCASSIDDFLNLFLQLKRGSDNFNITFRKTFKAEQYQKILPFVLKWRNLIRTGRNKSKEPSERELPNSLIQI
jgi:hypothetical protein